MEQQVHTPEPYDYRQYDRVWQRVAPTLEPYPDMQMAETTAAEMPQLRQESQLPGAESNPCCMGTAAAEMLEVLTGFVEEELEDRRRLLELSRQAPAWARQRLRDMAAEETGHAQRLMTVYYLITGTCYRPRISVQRLPAERWCPALRQRYHDAACNGLNYARAAEGTTDPCLREVLNRMSAEEYGHANRLLAMLERSLRSGG